MPMPTPSPLPAELEQRLFEAARDVARRAWAPASGFTVGAALLCADAAGGEEIVPGCNVETASLGLTVCAERSAMFRAVADGRRELRAVAVWTPLVEPAAPCGACRQVLAEFAVPGCIVLLGGPDGITHRTTLDELLPRPFTFESFHAVGAQAAASSSSGRSQSGASQSGPSRSGPTQSEQETP